MKRTLTLLAVFVSMTVSAIAQWAAMGSGLNGQVRALAVHNNTLYAGGNFGNPAYVAKWNASSGTWSVAGNGLNGMVYSLATHGGKLYAAGMFTANGASTSCKYVAVLNESNSTWEQVGSLTNFGTCLYSDGTTLYLGGAFSGTVAKVAQLTGTNWVQVGTTSTLSSIPRAITKFGGSLYIAGEFTGILAKLNGTTWQNIGSGASLAGVGYSLSSHAGYLYVGGKFSGSSLNLIRYNGTSFSSPFNSVNDSVFTMTSSGYWLFGGGAFTTSPSTGGSLPRFFKTNGASPFDAVGGFNATVYSTVNWNGRIVVGGRFSTAGTLAANNIAISSTTIDINELEDAVVSKEFFPNPMVSAAVARFTTKEYLKNASLLIIDQQGRTVREIPSDRMGNDLSIEFPIDRNGLSAGVYYYFLTSEGRSVVSDKFIVQ